MRFANFLLATTSLIPFGLSEAAAQCAPTSPTPGSTVNCGSGTYNGTLGNIGFLHQGLTDQVNVNVAPTTGTDAIVNGGQDSAIIFRDGAP